MKNISSIVVVMLVSICTYAQDVVPNMARISGKGIMVFAGENIPAARGQVTGYRIERKASGEAEFKKVAELTAVTSLAQFSAQFHGVNKILPYTPSLDGIKVDSAWYKGTAAGTVKPLGVIGFSLPVLYGFNMVWLDEDVKENTAYQYKVVALGTKKEMRSENITYKKEQNLNPMGYRDQDMENGKVTMRWYATGKNIPVNLEVYRSENKGAYSLVNTQVRVKYAHDTAFYIITDNTAAALQVYQYTLKSYDVLGNSSVARDTAYFASLDYMNMPLPENINAREDLENRAIHISWTLKQAAVIKLVNLYRSTNSVTGFKRIATLAADDTVYIDQQTTPATSYFYYFDVVYKMDNKSKRSASFAGKYQYYGKPATPADVLAGATANGIEITWNHTGKLVKGFWVYRSQPGTDMQQVSGFIPVNDKGNYIFTDSANSLDKNTFYGYAVKAISTSDVTSDYSDTSLAKVVSATPPPSPVNVEIVQNGNKVSLYWKDMHEIDEDIVGYQVVKINGNSKTDTVVCRNNFLNDNDAKAGTRYAVISINVFGMASAPSGEIEKNDD